MLPPLLKTSATPLSSFRVHLASPALLVVSVALLGWSLGSTASAGTMPPSTQANPADCRVDGAASRNVVASIRVADPTGASIDHASVEVRCGVVVHTSLTDGNGEVHIAVRPGTYHLTASAAGFAQVVQMVTLPTLASVVVTLPLGAASDVVNVSADSGLLAYATSFGSKTNTPLSELPQTINVVTDHEIDIRNAQSVNEVLRYTPGVETDEYGFELRQDWMLVRGFSADQFGVFRDGMRWNSLAGKVDPYELQSVEVIKGPASVLYGQAPPGGLVNLTTKTPSAERSNTVEAQFGNYDRRQGQLDLTGPFDHNNAYRYRLIGLIRNSNTQVNFLPDDRRLIAPELSWSPDERSSFVLLSDWQHDTTKWGQFLPASGTLYSNPNGQIPAYTFAGEPGEEGVVRDEASVGYLADHLFQDSWEIHQNYRYQYSNFEGSTVYGTGFAPGSSTELNRTYFSYPQHTYIHTLDTRALRHIVTKSWDHTLLAGFDFSDMAQATIGATSAVADLDIFHPVYGAVIPTPTPYLHNFEDTPQYGVYLQDQVKFKRHIAVTLGGREDWAVQDIRDFLYANNQHQNNSKFTGRAGIAYLSDVGINPYYSFSTSFQPTVGTDFFGKLFKPTYGEQNEAGVKIQPRNWSSFITASFFNIDQSNVLTTDPNPAHPFSTVQGGAVRSRGLELEVVSQPHRGISLHGGYSLIGTRYTQASTADSGEIGKWFPQVPRHQFSFLTDYAVPTGILAGLGGNFGLRFTGLSYGDSLNTLAIPNYTLLDASFRYPFHHTEFAINATNLTNKVYVATCTGVAYCGYGYERAVIGTARYHF